MRAIWVRDEFRALKDFTTNLPSTFDRDGVVIHNGRNIIKKMDTGQGALVVKNFAGMYFFNRLAYSLFRKSKAERSYQYSAVLNEKGIKTPPHVGWVDCYSMGLLTRSYFVSVFYPYQTFQEIVSYYDIFDPSYKEGLLHALAAFIYKLHLKGIYHEDLSIGNMLVIRTVKGYDFALVDLNRIRFREIDNLDAIRNFVTMRLEPEDLDTLIRAYARLRGQDEDEALKYFRNYRDRKFALRRIRRRIRKYTIRPLEALLNPKH